ncbi:MAG: FtsX-like permease family protein [Chloroflexi bacterium]|nr:FtsX-like permease family protein [Chloroflexota bacterium]
MNILLRTWAIFVVATKRLLSQRGLALATALGLVVAVALVMSVPLYADAVYYRILRQELSGGENVPGGSTTRPPFAFMFRYLGAWHGPVQWEDVQQLDQYLTEHTEASLGLPQKLMVRHFKTNNFRLFPQEDIAYADTKQPLAWVSFAFVSDLEKHITLLEGNFPAVAEPVDNSVVEVLVSEPRALELGLQVGETYIAFDRRGTQGGRSIQIPVRIAGVWKATDPDEEYWFYKPAALEDLLLVPESTFAGRISPYLEDEVYLALWYFVMDGSNVHSSDVGSLLTRITAMQQRVAALLPNTSLDVSPTDALQRYRKAASLLTILLYAFSVPIIGLILAFVGLVVGLTVGRQRGEIAILRSRGATAAQVVGIATLEALLLGVIALALGSPVGEMIAHVIGKARSFLNFTAQSDLRVGVTMASLRFGAVAIGLALVAQVMPTIGAARHTIVTYKQERARMLRPPWWQRAWVDILLLIPAAYGAYLLRQQGSIALPAGGGTMVNDPFQNPLLFLVPALGIFALTLFILRLLPAIMSAIAWGASHIGSVGVLLAARQLSRTPGLYTAPLILLVLTLSLSAFTASLAQTLDNHLYDQMYYKYGADMSLVELGESTETSGGGFGALGGGGGGGGGEATTPEEEEGPRWLFLPVSEHLKVPGVQAATRVGRYTATTRLSGGTQKGVFIGVDRVDFLKVAFWRWDFAPSSLGSLMNALAIAPEGVLVPRDFMAIHALNVGDTIRVSVDTYGQRTEMDMKVVGIIDLFPTWYPEEDGPLFVGNLEYLFEQAGGQFPYDVWLKTDPNADYYQIAEGVRDLNLRLLDWRAPLLEVAKEQQRPERQGLFGLLSVGFAAAALLTVLGFLLYALFSFRRRFIELGILRAVGLSSSQMAVFLAWELAFLILTGLVAGTALGAWVSELFIPYLQVGSGPSARIPPFLVEIAWPAILRIYALFGLLFVVALGALVALLLRMKIFQAVKLGETA